MTDYKQTLGEYRVGISFNPSGNPLVDEIKRKAAELIDRISKINGYEEANVSPRDNEVERLKALAMTHVEEAAMWAVKAATKQERE
jgi:hypothetical protein